MPLREIQIEQQCHGYKGGHQLLASSIKLSREDQDTIDRLSDISGQLRPNELFSPYITAYALPSKEFYVIARTWQDLEARRAGCVLTRSLLVREEDWAKTEDVAGVMQHLKEVNREQLDANSFAFRDSYPSTLPSVEVSQTVELVEALFLEERQPVAVFGGPQAELVITRLLTALWPGLKRSFSACSYALGPRPASGRAFDLIFTPKELRSRFARWDGRRIDGSGERERSVRHRWSVATARKIFEDPLPSLSKIDTLGILAGDSSGDESKLRLALLWNDLLDQSAESPTAVLGMLDILHSQKGGLTEDRFDVGAAIRTAIRRSKNMEASKQLSFLVPLAIKLDDFPISFSTSLELRRALSQASSLQIAHSLKLLSQVLPDSRFVSRLLFAGIGQGVANKAADFLEQRLFAALTDEQLLCFTAVSRPFTNTLIGESPGDCNEEWVERLTSALSFPSSSFTARAKRMVVAHLNSRYQAPLLRACVSGTSGVVVKTALYLIWARTKLANEAFDAILLAAVAGRLERLELRQEVMRLPESKYTDRFLIKSIEVTWEDLSWTLEDRFISPGRRIGFILSIISRADDNFLGRVSQATNAVEKLLTMLEPDGLSRSQRNAYLKILVWSNIKVDEVLPLAIAMLAEVNEPLRVDLVGQLVSKGLRFASSKSNKLLLSLLQDKGFSINTDHLVASAVSSESSPSRISDNLVMLNHSPSSVRKEILRYIDNLSWRLIQNRPELLSEAAYKSWAELIVDAGDINSIGQLQAAGNTLSFSFGQADPKVVPLVVASFPIVYKELRKGQDEPSLWSMFFPDWDRCKTVRKEVVRSFVQSRWAPSQFLQAALPTGDLERILQTLTKEDGGIGYLNLLHDYVLTLHSADFDQVLEAIEEALPSDDRDAKRGSRSERRKRKH